MWIATYGDALLTPAQYPRLLVLDPFPDHFPESTLEVNNPGGLNAPRKDPIRAFISYTWDDERHGAWVQAFATRLRVAGVDVRLDRWDCPAGASLTHFMEREIRIADYVLVICTPEYARRVNDRRAGGGYEGQVISAMILGGTDREKFIPVLRRGRFDPGAACGLPTLFTGVKAIDMRSDEQFEEQIGFVVRALCGQPDIPRPPLGRLDALRAEAAARAEAGEGSQRDSETCRHAWVLAARIGYGAELWWRCTVCGELHQEFPLAAY